MYKKHSLKTFEFVNKIFVTNYASDWNPLMGIRTQKAQKVFNAIQWLEETIENLSWRCVKVKKNISEIVSGVLN